MRPADFNKDGWCLEDAEERQAAHAKTFEIPPRWIRAGLEPGDFAQLIFRIAVDDDEGEEPEAHERMWVVVRERVGESYVGVLDNEPGSISENDEFWYGIDLPFEPRHVIDAKEGNEESARIAANPPKRQWR